MYVARLTQADGTKLLAPTPAALTAYAVSPRGVSDVGTPVTAIEGYTAQLPALQADVQRGCWKQVVDWDDHLDDTRREWLGASGP